MSAAMRDAGMEVIYGGTALNVDEIVNAAIQEDVDVIGLSMYGRFSVAYKVQEKLRNLSGGPFLVVGGTVPPQDVKALKEAGIEGVFVSGTSLDTIVTFIREKCRNRERK